MIASPPIQYLKRREIDTRKWDDCIGRAPNGRVYAYSFYLDAMADDWDALVIGDYTHVMPLPWRSKWGIRYLYQPFLVAQGGLFGPAISPDLLAAFIGKIPPRFRFIDICLNSGNPAPAAGAEWNLRNNYVLPLHKTYDEISAGYRENCRRNIRKAILSGVTVHTDFNPEEVAALALPVLQKDDRQAELTLERFKKLYGLLKEKQQAMTWGIRMGGKLMASCVFFFSHGRAYYILVGNHPNGKTMGASHTLIDAFIKAHAGSGLLLDFEGSDIRNLAFFYSGFGAVQELYPALRQNRLPFWLRWLKK